MRRLRQYGSGGYSGSGCRGRKNKKIKVNTSGNCIFHAYGEQTPQNRLLSVFAHHVTLPT
jgi:hypothetical protein